MMMDQLCSKLEIQTWKLSEIKPAPYNPRVISDEARDGLRNSITTFGLVEPIVVNKQTGHAVGGNQRLETLRQMGAEETDVVLVDLSLEDEKKLNVALNNRAIQGSWDVGKLEDLLEEFRTDNLIQFEDLKFTDLSNLPVTELTPVDSGGDGSDTSEEENCEDIPPVEESIVTKPGDYWIMGNHVLYCGSCLDRDAVGRLLGGHKAHMVFADPPYGISIVPGSEGRIGRSAKFYKAIQGDDSTDLAIESFKMFYELFPEAVHIWWGGNYYANALPPTPCWIIWDKKNSAVFADCEVAWTNNTSPMRIFRHMWNGGSRESETKTPRCHPTQKPIAMVDWVLEKYGDDVEVIFDPFAGSGITLLSAERSGRKCFGVEIEPGYCDVIVKRWMEQSGGVAYLRENNKSFDKADMLSKSF